MDVINQASDIRNEALRNAKWALLEAFLPRIVSPLVTILLARFLNPEDYGIVAISGLVVTLAMSFQSQGVGDALVQMDDATQQAKSTVFWISLGVGAFFSLLIFFSASTIASLFKDDRLTLAIRVQAWQLVITALGSTHVAILRRQFDFRKIALIRVIPSLSPCFIGLPLAYMGFGYWSLIVSIMSAELISLIFIYMFLPWLPSMESDLVTAKRLIWFASMVTVESLTAWFLTHGDNMIIGFISDLKTLGVYSYGFKLIMLFLGTLISPFTSYVVYSMYCRQANNREELVKSMNKICSNMAFLLFPVCFGIAAVSHSIIPIIFGKNWSGLASVVAILSISPGMTMILGPINDALKALGRPDILAKFYVLTVIIAVPVLCVTAKYGLIAFCFGRFSIPLILFFPKLFVAAHFLGVKTYDLIKPLLPFFVIAAGMAIFVRVGLAVGGGSLHSAMAASAGITFGIIFYGLGVHIYDKRVIRQFMSTSLNVFFK